MVELPSFVDATQIFEVSGCKVFRARHKHNNKPVLIKWLARNTNFKWFVSLLQHEYEVSCKLDLLSIVQPLELIEKAIILR